MDEIEDLLRRVTAEQQAELRVLLADLDAIDDPIPWQPMKPVPGQFGTNGRPVITVPFPIYPECVDLLIQLLYETSLISHLTAYEAPQLEPPVTPEKIDEAPIEMAVSYLARIVRQERFSDGLIAEAIDRGTMSAALHRIVRWCEESS